MAEENNQNMGQGQPGTPENIPMGDPKDVEENKLIAAVGYLGILFLIPLLAKKDSPFAQFHAKQGMVLCIVGFVGSFIMWIPFVGWAIGIFLLVMWIMGIVNALGGKMKELPIIGEYAKKINI